MKTRGNDSLYHQKRASDLAVLFFFYPVHEKDDLLPVQPCRPSRGLDNLPDAAADRIQLRAGYGEHVLATSGNPHGYVITPLEAANLPLSLPDLDAATINGNYALEAGLPAEYPALDIETFDDETTVKRTNFLVVKEGNENSEKTQALIKALQSDKVQKYIDDTYKGAVITSFIDAQ